MNSIRLDKFLVLKNICSRSKCISFLKSNNVVVNDIYISKKDYKVYENDLIFINGKKYTYNKFVYFLINKPKGYICSNVDELYPSVLNLLEDNDYQIDLFTVGRLDVDTTGVLLITNDGKYSTSLLNPKKNIYKTYDVTLENEIDDNSIKLLSSGVIIDSDHFTKAYDIKVIDKNNISFSITEGKHHQVKKMIRAIDNYVLDLNRSKFKDYDVNDLDVKKYKKITI